MAQRAQPVRRMWSLGLQRPQLSAAFAVRLSQSRRQEPSPRSTLMPMVRPTADTACGFTAPRTPAASISPTTHSNRLPPSAVRGSLTASIVFQRSNLAWAPCNYVRSRRRVLPVALLHVLRTRSTDSGVWWFEDRALVKEGAQVKRGLPARKTAGRPQRHRRPIAAEHGDPLSVLADSARFVTGIAIYDKMRFASQK